MSQQPETTDRISYSKARALVLAAGVAVLVLLAVFLFLRGVDPIEITGTLLFLPVFIGFVFWGITGGLVAGVLAALIYAGLRYPALQTVGSKEYLKLVLSRSVYYLVFGAIGGWATRQMSASLEKLELYDRIDDDTGLYNARFFTQDTDLELSRSTRYKTIFSVAIVDLPSGPMASLSRRQSQGLMKDIGRVLRESLRTVDKGVHARGATTHRLAVILPETGREGVEIFAGRLATKLTEFLNERGVPVAPNEVKWQGLTLPEDEEKLAVARQEFAAIAKAEHPED